jgi:hypothetical protein
MITGSIAANFYTVPRMTRDIDIVVELFEQDIGRFIPLFENDYYLEPQTVGEAVRNKGMFNLIHDQYIVKIDFVGAEGYTLPAPRILQKKKNYGRQSGSLRCVAGGSHPI